MDNPDKAALVTRREFYSALGIVWLSFMLSFSQAAAPSRPAAIGLSIIAFVMSMIYLVSAMRSRATK